MQKVIVILPAYNESENLKILLERFIPLAYKVLVVDDGSQDGTSAVAESFKDRLDIGVIKHPINMGLGAAIRTGFKEVLTLAQKDDFVVVMDADNSHPPDLIPEMLQKIEGFDVVIASRYMEGSLVTGVSAPRKLLSFIAGTVFKTLFHIKNVRDYTSSYRMIRIPLLEKVARLTGRNFVNENGFACAAEFLLNLHLCGARFNEAPLHLRYDLKAGKTKIKFARTIFRYFLLILRFAPKISRPWSCHD